ncbi:MAG: quinonprotein alcohol dehydrogenase [Candidatus Rokubacteria bacterium 13_1_40CM_69_27]|nr:MAG: quinonprotein alcohol dehydrogenase [Candidatus Rokubacteria bacterium 13_1_40CM_69_27]
MTRSASARTVLLLVTTLLLVPTAASPQTLDDLKNDGKNTDNVLTYGMGYHQQRYSPLKEINTSNVKRLVPVWNLSLDNQWGEQAQPFIYDGVMYVTNAKYTVAIDVATGKQIWRTALDWVPETPRVVCCGVSNKGAAILNGKLFRTTLDAFVVALEMKTGKEIWKQKVAEWKDGYSLTVAPQIANGVLITGISGAEFGTRGFLDGWDPETGKQLWRRYTIPAPGEPGGETWPPGDAYLRGGGSTWITGSYDPDLDLAYWGIGNAGPWNPAPRPGDNLYTASVLALKPKTGEIAWHYQFTPNDAYDYDASWELILGDVKVDGVARKVAMQLNRNGFLYVLDRTNGKLLSAKPYEKVNWAERVDMATGRPVESEVARRLRAGEQIELWPGTRGAKNWPHAAFDPNTGLLYANTMHAARLYRHIPVEPHKPGSRYQFVENKPAPHPAGEPIAHIEAIDPMTAKPRWRTPLYDQPHWSAVLATGGGLLFTGKMTGEFIAIDADTGQTLWQFQTGSGVNAQPITWTHKGRQYVTVLSGVGGLWWNVARESLKNVPQGGSVWTFALFQD